MIRSGWNSRAIFSPRSAIFFSSILGFLPLIQPAATLGTVKVDSLTYASRSSWDYTRDREPAFAVGRDKPA